MKDLEINLAAGLDIPTAIVASEDEETPRRSGCAFFLYLILGMLGILFALKLIVYETNQMQTVPMTAEVEK